MSNPTDKELLDALPEGKYEVWRSTSDLMATYAFGLGTEPDLFWDKLANEWSNRVWAFAATKQMDQGGRQFVRSGVEWVQVEQPTPTPEFFDGAPEGDYTFYRGIPNGDYTPASWAVAADRVDGVDYTYTPDQGWRTVSETRLNPGAVDTLVKNAQNIWEVVTRPVFALPDGFFDLPDDAEGEYRFYVPKDASKPWHSCYALPAAQKGSEGYIRRPGEPWRSGRNLGTNAFVARSGSLWVEVFRPVKAVPKVGDKVKITTVRTAIQTGTFQGLNTYSGDPIVSGQMDVNVESDVEILEEFVPEVELPEKFHPLIQKWYDEKFDGQIKRVGFVEADGTDHVSRWNRLWLETDDGSLSYTVIGGGWITGYSHQPRYGEATWTTQIPAKPLNLTAFDAKPGTRFKDPLTGARYILGDQHGGSTVAGQVKPALVRYKMPSKLTSGAENSGMISLGSNKLQIVDRLVPVGKGK